MNEPIPIFSSEAYYTQDSSAAIYDAKCDLVTTPNNLATLFSCVALLVIMYSDSYFAKRNSRTTGRCDRSNDLENTIKQLGTLLCLIVVYFK